MKLYRADLHIHTGLSPCASEEMTPRAIVDTAIERGLGIIAICDHNTAEAAGLVHETAEGRLYVIHGMEITTEEEVHVIGLFPDRKTALAVSSKVKDSLYGRKRRNTKPGNGREELIGKGMYFLSSATGLSLVECVETIKAHGGLAVAAHVDRPSFSVYSQLGFIPEDAGFNAVEITAASSHWKRLSDIDLPVIASSDSHCLWDMGKIYTAFELKKPVWEEIFLALGGSNERRFWIA